MSVVDIVLLVLVLPLLCPCLVLLVECLAAAGPDAGQPLEEGPGPRTAVVVPAHDEAAGIGETVASLREQLRAGQTLLVVADNCSDGTAELAREAGAEVLERHDPDRRGKGYAITHAVEHLSVAPPDVVVLVDADCRVSPGDGLARLARRAFQEQRPIQAEYVFSAGGPASPRNVMSQLAILVRNRVRPRGLARLGLPCQLTGSGMALPWPLLRDAPPGRSHLVEDLVLGIELALRGAAPRLCPQVSITSELPPEDRALFGQRRRWEHGHLATLLGYGPRLLGAGLLRARLDPLALGLDLMVPPLAMLVLLLLFVLAAAGVAAWQGSSTLPLILALAGLGAVAVAVGRAWWSFARTTIPLRTLWAIPFYVLWKVPLYVGFLLRGGQRSWERTRRKGDLP